MVLKYYFNVMHTNDKYSMLILNKHGEEVLTILKWQGVTTFFKLMQPMVFLHVSTRFS